MIRLRALLAALLAKLRPDPIARQQAKLRREIAAHDRLMAQPMPKRGERS